MHWEVLSLLILRILIMDLLPSYFVEGGGGGEEGKI